MNRRDLLQGAAGATLALKTGGLGAQGSGLLENPIPGTDETLPAIGIGTNRYAVGDDNENLQLLRTLRSFSQLGGTVIDTAPMYRSSETILGRLIAELEIRDRIFLATKSDRDQGDATCVDASVHGAWSPGCGFDWPEAVAAGLAWANGSRSARVDSLAWAALRSRGAAGFPDATAVA